MMLKQKLKIGMLLCLATVGSVVGSTYATAEVANKQQLHRDDNKVVKAITDLEKKDLKAAYQVLETVDMDTMSYRMAYLEMQKIHYRIQAWDHFFGFATFYRKKLLPEFLQPELISLEALALTKHCQFDAASQVVLMGQELVKSLREGEKSNYPAIVSLWKREMKRYAGSKVELVKALDRLDADLGAVENLLLLQSEMPGRVTSKPIAKKVHLFSKDMFWNIDEESTKRKIVEKAVLSPKALRVYVGNICGSAT